MNSVNPQHAAIRIFLQDVRICALVAAQPDDAHFIKAGLLPFVKSEGGFAYYVMKPVAKQPELGDPPFQLCKGTRMFYTSELGWRDLHKTPAEPHEKERLVETALREGIEELGLKLDNILALYDVGAYDFASVSTGKLKKMWLFACEMKSIGDFLPDRDIAATTQARRWISTQEFVQNGRSDHKTILADVDSKLSPLYKELRH